MTKLLLGILLLPPLPAATPVRSPAPLPIQSDSFVFKQTPQGPLYLFVQFPPEWQRSDRRPAIIFFFGGGWKTGSVGQFARQAEYLAARGMVAVRADYRVEDRQGTTPVEAVQDGKSAVRWVRAHSAELGVDPNRLVAAGGSAGGHLAACTVQCPDIEPPGEDSTGSTRPDALVLFNPVVKLVGLFDSAARSLPPATAYSISPVLHVRSGNPPALLLFGTEDPFLPPALAYADTLRSHGIRTDFYTAPGVGHGFFNRSPWLERTLARVDEFLASLGYLTGKPTLAVP